MEKQQPCRHLNSANATKSRGRFEVETKDKVEEQVLQPIQWARVKNWVYPYMYPYFKFTMGRFIC
jgi:hypothetical protein